ncbi:hypothetical protein A7D27_23435 [Pseudomonas sp. 1D4]|uniref:PAAR-like domain-containing protein n=1 Tax=Pseudomonadaceae TaxID=135621 RepID=UPI00084BB042|nr:MULTISPECIES: PAAR-like domain-containing protein [Pseudomonas]OEC38041.1 hypothetical protein A7D27_23435 [Pseudomonas sp. 1D4]OEC50439.1 hypothetical protein A9G05_24435 [Pseudomonas sp. ENNP23]
MANQVYANNMEVSCKAADGKSVACFPDVCFTPPQAPPTPTGVPIPYPNTGMAKDTTNGTRTIKISGQEVMLKNKSYFKTSYGDEAGCAPKKGVVTSKIKGKVYFTAWSMNVKFESLNVVRMMDLTTHNHASFPGNTPTWPYIDEVATGAPGKGCEEERKNVKDKCSGDHDKDCKDDACQNAKKCMLVPYTARATENQTGCCEGETPHHLVEVHCFTEAGGRKDKTRLSGFSAYDDTRAPCVCVTGSRYTGTHGNMHAIQNTAEKGYMVPESAGGPRSQMGGKDDAWNYGAAKKTGIFAHQKTFPTSGKDGKPCSEACLAAQLDNYHKQVGVTDDKTPLRADRSPLKDEQKEWGATQLESMDDD